jgi:hypothetical protein
MNAEALQKLEIINQFKMQYPEWINPELISIKYCQNSVDAFLEMTFINNPNLPIIINLDFISDDFDTETEIEEIPALFNPESDVVDNAKTFIELDTYSLINCVDGLFSKEAEEIINTEYLKRRK